MTTTDDIDDADDATDGDGVTDRDDACGLGGVMGGTHSGASEETRDVFIESAWFDPAVTRVTGRETGIDSDAKYRFERGMDPGFVVDGLELATRMVMTLCGGEPSDVAMAGSLPEAPAPIAFDPADIKRLLGIEIEPARMADMLERLGFACDTGAALWTVQVPSWRRDCSQSADLVEEIARLYGYDNLPTLSFARPEGERIDAVGIVTPNHVHYPVAKAFVEAVER